jgi:hypothetical protein
MSSAAEANIRSIDKNSQPGDSRRWAFFDYIVITGLILVLTPGSGGKKRPL